MQANNDARPAIPADVARAILIESGHRCAVCGEGCPIERAHIIPWNKTKDHSAENLVCFCANCHQRADTEDWGVKTMREYKERPWVKSKFTERESPSKVSKITVTIDMDIRDYDENRKRMLEFALAAFLNISPATVRAIAVESGSVKVTLLVPSECVSTLISAMKLRKSELFAYLVPLRVKALAEEVVTVRERAAAGCAKLFVGNLSFNASENDLSDAFAAHGTVVEANLMMDRMTGRPRGFAFVTMSSAEEAQKAIDALNGQQLDGRALTVNVARPREERAVRKDTNRGDRS